MQAEIYTHPTTVLVEVLRMVEAAPAAAVAAAPWVTAMAEVEAEAAAEARRR